jgi:hypothetical protein
MAAHACVGVGAEKWRPNQAATAGWNRAFGIIGRRMCEVPRICALVARVQVAAANGAAHDGGGRLMK